MKTCQRFDIVSRNRFFRSWGIAAVAVGLFAAPSSILAGEGKPDKPAPDGDPRRVVYLVPNFHPACCGWLTDWSTERNYCANSYIDHLDRVRDDPNYAFALSEVHEHDRHPQLPPGAVGGAEAAHPRGAGGAVQRLLPRTDHQPLRRRGAGQDAASRVCAGSSRCSASVRAMPG